jgi:hypothetical protein
MKTLLLILPLTALLSAADVELNPPPPSKYTSTRDSVVPICKAGYLYYVFNGYRQGGIIQAFKRGKAKYDGNYPPQPITCKYKDNK